LTLLNKLEQQMVKFGRAANSTLQVTLKNDVSPLPFTPFTDVVSFSFLPRAAFLA